MTETPSREHRLSVVIPVYGGEKTLRGVVESLAPYVEGATSPGGREFRVTEVILVWDRGRDRSDRVIRELRDELPWVRAVWLSQNFGQHAATLAGMASSGEEWVVTMDEDGQHDPVYLGNLLDAAMDQRASLVYAKPTNEPSHGFVRNLASRGSKAVIKVVLAGTDSRLFQSYRLMLGSVARSAAAYAGSGVYLDVVLSWIAGHPATADIELRDEGDRVSGYNYRRLLGHFWRMVLTSGTRGLRLVSVLGGVFAVSGVILALFVLAQRIFGANIQAGWASTMIVMLLGFGGIMIALGIIAEYLGVTLNTSLGKPLYVLSEDPERGPLGRDERK